MSGTVTGFTTEWQPHCISVKKLLLKKKISSPAENRSSVNRVKLNPEAETLKNGYSRVACYFFIWHTTEYLNSLLSPLRTLFFSQQIPLEIWGGTKNINIQALRELPILKELTLWLKTCGLTNTVVKRMF